MFKILYTLILTFSYFVQVSGQESFDIQFENQTISINGVGQLSEDDEQWKFIQTLMNTTDVEYYCQFYPAGDCLITKELLEKYAKYYLDYKMKPINKVQFTLGNKNLVLFVYKMVHNNTGAVKVANYMLHLDGNILKFIDTKTEMSLYTLKAMLALIKPDTYNDMLYKREDLATSRLFRSRKDEPFLFENLYMNYIDIVKESSYSEDEAAVRVPYMGPSSDELSITKLVEFGMESSKAQQMKNLYDRGLYHYARNEILSTLNEEQLIQLDNHDVKK